MTKKMSVDAEFIFVGEVMNCTDPLVIVFECQHPQSVFQYTRHVHKPNGSTSIKFLFICWQGEACTISYVYKFLSIFFKYCKTSFANASY